MNKINRRSFINKTSLSLGGLIAFSQLPAQLMVNKPVGSVDFSIGFQTYPIRDMLAKDFSGTLKTMAGFGYKLTELCSPVGYEKMGFGFLSGMKPAAIKTVIEDAGLSCPSCHFGKAELTPGNIDKTIELAQALGLSQMICATFWLPKEATINDYQKEADNLNKAGEKIKSAGMQAGFHNHDMEFKMLEGQLIYDALMNGFDPDLVKMQFQTQVITLGYKGADYFKKYPGRFISAHLSDWTADKKEVPVGKGTIDWKEFFAAAKTGGLKNIFVEMNFDTFKDSNKYLQNLKA